MAGSYSVDNYSGKKVALKLSICKIKVAEAEKEYKSVLFFLLYLQKIYILPVAKPGVFV